MNARPQKLAPALPPIGCGEARFSCRIQGVDLDCSVSDGEDGFEVRAIWHAGVDVGEIVSESVDQAIEQAWRKHVDDWNTDMAIERKYG